MAPGEAPSHEDWLAKEVEESDSAKNLEALTLVLLKKAEEIQKKHPEHEEIKKEYEDVRKATILSLRELQGETTGNLDELKTNLAEDTSLSEGTINEQEFQKIHDEFQELRELDKEHHITELEETLEKTNLTDTYGMILSLLYEIDVDTDLIDNIKKELLGTGKISFKSLKEMKEAAFGELDVDKIIQDEMDKKIEEGFKGEDLSKLLEEVGSKEGAEATSYNIALKKGLGIYLVQAQNSQHLEDFLFTYMDDVSPPGMCDRETSLLIEMLRAKFLENKNIDIQDNLGNYYKNQGITEKQLEGKSEELRKLGEVLKSGDCTLDALGEIRSFNEIHFPDTDFSTTKEDALKIISSVLKYKEADVDVLESEAERTEDEKTKTDLFEKAEDKRLSLETQEKSLKEIEEMSHEEYEEMLVLIKKVSELTGQKLSTDNIKSLKYVLKDPKSRIQEVGTSAEVLKIFDTYSRENYKAFGDDGSPKKIAFAKVMNGLESLSISDISPSTLSISVIKKFPGNFDSFQEIPFVWFQDNPELIGIILAKSGDNKLLYHLSQNSKGPELIISTLGDQPEIIDSRGRNITDNIFNNPPLALITADRNKKLPISESDRDIPGLILTQESFEQWVENLLNNDLIGTSKYKYDPLNRFIEKFGTTGNEPLIKRLIKGGHGSRLSTLKIDEGNLDIGLMLLSDDNGNFGNGRDILALSHIPVSLRSTEAFVDKMLLIAKNNSPGEKYLGMVEITTIQDAIYFVPKMRDMGTPITGKMNSKLNVIFSKLSNGDKKSMMMSSENRKLLGQVFQEIEAYKTNTQETQQLQEYFSKNKEKIQQVRNYIQGTFPEKNTDTELLINQLQVSESGLPNSEAYLTIEKLFGSIENTQERMKAIGEFIQGLSKIEIQKLELQEKKRESQVFNIENLSLQQSKLFTLNSQSEYRFDGQKTQKLFSQFLETQDLNSTSLAEIHEGFAITYGLEGEIKTLVLGSLTGAAKISAHKQILALKPTKVAELARDGKLISYYNEVEQAYALGIPVEKVPVPKSKGEKISLEEKQTIEDSTSFTQSEISDLSPEEVNILTGDNEIARENLMNMHETLERLNLEFVWKHRHKYLIAMGNPDIKNDTQGSIDKSELLKILNYTLKVIGEESHYSNIDGAENAIKTINDSQSNALKKNSFGRSDIEQMFWNKGYIDENIGLNITNIRDTSRHISE